MVYDVVVRGLDSHPDYLRSNLAAGNSPFFLFLHIYPNFKGKFLVSVKFSDRGAKLIAK